MDQVFYKKALADAQEAVKDIEDAELKKSGFEVILKQLLQNAPAPAAGATLLSAPDTGSKVNNNGRANRSGLTDDETNTLFEVKGEVVILKVQPSGVSVSEQQQTLAHAILVGNLALLGKDSVSSPAMGAAARDWNLLDTNFSRTILVPGYIQSKGVRRGVHYSLKPGAVGKIKEALQKMARGE